MAFSKIIALTVGASVQAVIVQCPAVSITVNQDSDSQQTDSARPYIRQTIIQFILLRCFLSPILLPFLSNAEASQLIDQQLRTPQSK